MVRRSMLFTPGDEPEKMRKALDTDADAVIFDLEDAVAPDAKAKARAAVRELLSDTESSTLEVCVRINPLEEGGRKDIAAITMTNKGGPNSIVVPKVDSRDDIDLVAERLHAEESAVDILAIIETAAGLVNAADVAAAPQVDALLFGAEDFAADIGASRTEEGTEVLYAREHTVVTATTAQIEALDTVYTDIENLERLREDTRFAIQLGFDGKIAIHPAQIEVINDTFTPPKDEVEWAKKVMAAKRKADEKDKGVFRVKGKMVDGPMIEQAEQIIERAEAADIR